MISLYRGVEKFIYNVAESNLFEDRDYNDEIFDGSSVTNILIDVENPAEEEEEHISLLLDVFGSFLWEKILVRTKYSDIKINVELNVRLSTRGTLVVSKIQYMILDKCCEDHIRELGLRYSRYCAFSIEVVMSEVVNQIDVGITSVVRSHITSESLFFATNSQGRALMIKIDGLDSSVEDITDNFHPYRLKRFEETHYGQIILITEENTVIMGILDTAEDKTYLIDKYDLSDSQSVRIENITFYNVKMFHSINRIRQSTDGIILALLDDGRILMESHEEKADPKYYDNILFEDFDIDHIGSIIGKAIDGKFYKLSESFREVQILNIPSDLSFNVRLPSMVKSARR